MKKNRVLFNKVSELREFKDNAYNKAIYDVFLENLGSEAEAPASYSWMVDIDTPGAYYKIGQYDFLDIDGNSIQNFDIYGLVESHPAEILAGYPKVLVCSLENEIKPKLSALFDGYQQNSNKLDRIETEVSHRDKFILERIK